ncbi:hypothetical protein DEFR109230_18795 [Deinococcus frigens]
MPPAGPHEEAAVGLGTAGRRVAGAGGGQPDPAARRRQRHYPDRFRCQRARRPGAERQHHLPERHGAGDRSASGGPGVPHPHPGQRSADRAGALAGPGRHGGLRRPLPPERVRRAERAADPGPDRGSGDLAAAQPPDFGHRRRQQLRQVQSCGDRRGPDQAQLHRRRRLRRGQAGFARGRGFPPPAREIPPPRCPHPPRRIARRSSRLRQDSSC